MRKNIAVLLTFSIFFFTFNLAHATISPKKGHKFPKVYIERLKTTPGAFTYKYGYLKTVQRIQENIRALADGKITAAAAAAQGGLKISGIRSIPVFMTKYSNTGADPYAAADLQQELFSGPWPTGTMKEFYEENSYGAFSVNGTVYNWVTLANKDTYYEGSANGVGYDSKVGELISETLSSWDATVNFASYDNDGPDGTPNSGDDDGYVDFVAFVHPEVGGECGGNNNIWSHRWVYSGWTGSDYTTNDAKAGGGFIKVDDYVIMPAFSCSGTTMIEIGVFCHEFGHAFGLPDLYDTDGTSEGLGHWCLMAAGNWNTPASPAHFSTWCKVQLGWITPVTQAVNQNAKSIANIEENPVVYKLVDKMPSGQYFLVSNHQRIGFDQNLLGEGLLIWHIDENVITANLPSNSVNNNENHYGVDLEQADGLRDLNNANNRGDGGDSFQGTSNNRSFTNSTNPNSRPYGGGSSKVKVTNISALQDPMIADLKITPILNIIGIILAVILTAFVLIWMLKRKRFIS